MKYKRILEVNKKKFEGYCFYYLLEVENWVLNEKTWRWKENEKMKFCVLNFWGIWVGSKLPVLSYSELRWRCFFQTLQDISFFIAYMCHSHFPKSVLKFNFLRVLFVIEFFWYIVFLFRILFYNLLLLIQCLIARYEFSLYLVIRILQ